VSAEAIFGKDFVFSQFLPAQFQNQYMTSKAPKKELNKSALTFKEQHVPISLTTIPT